MKYSKTLLFISCLMVLAMAEQLGDVVDGNYNEGVGNTILSAGNFVKGDGNIVASLDSDLDIFGGDPFFSSTDLYDPIKPVQTTPVITSPIYPGPIPTATTTTTTQQTVVTPTPTATQTPIATPVASQADEAQTLPTQTTQVTHTETVQTTPTTEGTTSTSVTTKTTETTTTTNEQSKVGSSSSQVKVQSKGQGYMYAGILGLITAIIVAS